MTYTFIDVWHWLEIESRMRNQEVRMRHLVQTMTPITTPIRIMKNTSVTESPNLGLARHVVTPVNKLVVMSILSTQTSVQNLWLLVLFGTGAVAFDSTARLLLKPEMEALSCPVAAETIDAAVLDASWSAASENNCFFFR